MHWLRLKNQGGLLKRIFAARPANFFFFFAPFLFNRHCLCSCLLVDCVYCKPLVPPHSKQKACENQLIDLLLRRSLRNLKKHRTPLIPSSHSVCRLHMLAYTLYNPCATLCFFAARQWVVPLWSDYGNMKVIKVGPRSPLSNLCRHPLQHCQIKSKHSRSCGRAEEMLQSRCSLFGMACVWGQHS